ncbi:MAG: SDR family oxidoreductase [Wenzhouxiangella sp.]
MKRLLIAGCGDLGIRLSRRLRPEDWLIHGLRRHPEQLPAHIQRLRADLQEPASLALVAGHWDAVIYQATPDQRTPEAYRAAYVEGLDNLLAACHSDRLIFVSSTAVYGQDDGSWVDEDSPTAPSAFTGQLLLEAEALCARSGGLSVRFSGIYGPGRDYLIRSLVSGTARCRARPPQWTNRIHAEDCAAVLAHLLDLSEPAPVYCASDALPAPRCEVLDWLAGQLGLPPPDREGQDGGQGKRVANHRLIDSGFVFQYPDYRTGYRELLP